MPEMTRLSYWELMRWRPEAVSRFGGMLDLRIVRGLYEEMKAQYPGGRVLDIGSGEGHPTRRALGLTGDSYCSLDSDARSQPTFTSFDQIPQELLFDFVVMNQVLEHMSPDDAYDTLTAAKRQMRPGGNLFATVPNAGHPNRFFSNVTHITNWNFCDLYGIAKAAGFEVLDLARSNKRRLTWNPVRRFIVNTVCREFRVDWCDSLLVVAQRPTED